LVSKGMGGAQIESYGGPPRKQ